MMIICSFKGVYECQWLLINNWHSYTPLNGVLYYTIIYYIIIHTYAPLLVMIMSDLDKIVQPTDVRVPLCEASRPPSAVDLFTCHGVFVRWSVEARGLTHCLLETRDNKHTRVIPDFCCHWRYLASSVVWRNNAAVIFTTRPIPQTWRHIARHSIHQLPSSTTGSLEGDGSGIEDTRTTFLIYWFYWMRCCYGFPGD